MLEVRTNSFCLASSLIPCRLHQGHIPTRTFSVNLDKTARAQGICQSFSIMQICWGAIDHGRGNSGGTPFLAQTMLSFLRRVRHFEPDGLSG